MKKSLFLLLILLFATIPAQAQEPSQDLLALVARAESSYTNVRDYVCVFEKEEADGGKLDKKEEIYLKFEKPFKIFMHWRNAPKKGLQVMYERGRHNNKLVIHKPSLFLKLVPVIFLDQNSPWVRTGSKSYNIEDAGIGIFLMYFERQTRETAANKTLRVSKTHVPGVQGDAYDVYFEKSTPNSDFMAYHVRVVFDPKTGLPVFQELHDWNDQIKGRYYYRDLRLNVGDEASFQKNIHPSLFKIYNSKK